jgi:hypothetical protein
MEDTPPDGVWNPDTNVDPFARREFMVVMASDYSPTALPFYTTDHPDLKLNGAELDLMYVFWPLQASTAGGAPIPVDDGDKLRIQLAQSGNANDYFTFATHAPSRSNVALAKDQLALVKAVPNPYFAHSAYELDQFNRQIKFTHLPAQCTVRLFTLAGSLVRTIQKNDGSTSS